MSGGFKWIELGIHQVIHDEDGKVLGHIITDAPSARKMPVRAYIDGKEFGMYISAAHARQAVEDAMANRHRNSGMNSGRVSE